MANQILASDQLVSEIINPSSADALERTTPSGHVLIAFYGTMTSDEKWQIEQADADQETLEWVAIHTTDFLTATAAPGASGTTATVDRWMGGRDGNRAFEVPIGKGNYYRVRLVYKSGSSNPTTNGTVTCSWVPGVTKQWG